MTAIFEIRSGIEAIVQNAALFEEKNFEQRVEAIDRLGFHIIERIEGLLQKEVQRDELAFLKYRAEKIIAELEAVDVKLFQKLRKNIQTGRYTGRSFIDLIREYVDIDLQDNEHQEQAGYDDLDIFINGLLSFQALPEQTKGLEPEMVYYQKTPARVVFELVEKCNFTRDDIFIDLGSGLGQVAIMVNLLTGIKTKGIEFEPAFCAYAADSAAALNLPNVTFVNVDARKAGYSEGTVFFLYTPFTGGILKEVLDILRKEAMLRTIRVITYGPCTAEVATQGWPHSITPKDDNIYKLVFFSSL